MHCCDGKCRCNGLIIFQCVCVRAEARCSAAGSIMRCWEVMERRADEPRKPVEIRSVGGGMGAYWVLQSC